MVAWHFNMMAVRVYQTLIFRYTHFDEKRQTEKLMEHAIKQKHRVYIATCLCFCVCVCVCVKMRESIERNNMKTPRRRVVVVVVFVIFKKKKK